MNVETGALTQQPGVESTVGSPAVPGISPDGRFLFVPDYSNNLVQSFSAQPEGPSAIAGAAAATGSMPNAAIPAPEGDALWTADYTGGTTSGLSIGGSGGLTVLTGFPLTTGGNPTTLAVSPRNDFVYLPAYGGTQIAGFRRGTDGSLTPLTDSPFARSGSPIDVEFSPDGGKLFVALQADDAIAAYTVNQATGTLTEIDSPTATDDAPTGIAVSPDGHFLFVANNADNTIQSFTISTGGSLAPADSESTGNAPGDVTVSPNGRFVYSANFWSGTISGFAVDQSSGALTELTGSPFGDLSGAVASFAIVPNQGPVAALTTSSVHLTATMDGSGSSDPDGSVTSYAWNFGDGQTATGSDASQAHTYSAAGTYTVSLTVTDDEGCSLEQIGTGQTLYCNGSAAAQIQRQVVVSAPPAAALTLTKASGQQARSRRNGRKVTRRARTRFSLNEKANVTFRFQKSRQGGTCRRAHASARHTIAFRNFGRAMTRPARGGSNQRTFARTVGGRRITPGRYRVQLQARNASGRTSKLVTTKSFCVR